MLLLTESLLRFSTKHLILTVNLFENFLMSKMKGLQQFHRRFSSCSSMDSTFLGILVSVAIKVRKSAEGGSFTLLNLRGRNLETVCNLGIHQIADISSDEVNDVEELENLSSKPSNLNANAHTIYKAHKALMSLNEKT